MNHFSGNGNNKTFRTLVIALAAIVVFVTTYSMILPAITIETTEAETMPGIMLSAESHSDADAADAKDPQDQAELKAAEETTKAPEETTKAPEEATKAPEETTKAPEETTKAPEETTKAPEETTKAPTPGEEETTLPAKEEETTAPGSGADQEETTTAEEETTQEETTEEDDRMPAMTFEAEIKRSGATVKAKGVTDEVKTNTDGTDLKDLVIKVKAEAEADTFPEGTTMKVKEVSDDQKVQDSVADKIDGRIKKMLACEITFYDKDGIEIEPAKEIKVTITSDTIKQEKEENDTDPVIVHIPDKGKTEIIDSIDERKLDKKIEDEEVIFETDRFSVYALVYEQITAEFVSAKGETYEITVTCGENAGIPEGAELKVTEIVKEDKEYADYLQQALTAVAGEDAANENAEAQDLFARFFDIEIRYGDQKIEPEDTVSVSIELKDAPEADIKVVHFEKDGPVVIDPDPEVTDSLQFTTDSFSVYATIVAPTPTGVNDLGGRSFTMRHNNQYMTANVATAATNLFAKTTNANDAAVWVFEETDQPGKYNIFTYVNGEKKYMHLDQRDVNRAHAALSDEPQAFTVTQENGNYVFSATSNGVTYYLNEFANSNGFAGWYQHDPNNDRFTLDFTQPAMQNNAQYITLVKYNNKYYIVNNNCTLTEVEYDEATNTVKLDEPMLWTVERNNPNGHIYFNSTEAGFNNLQIASDWYRRYLDPSTESAYLEESNEQGPGHVVIDQGHQWTYNGITYWEHHVTNRNDVLNNTTVNIDNSSTGDSKLYHIYHGSNYLGVVEDAQGDLRLAGQQSAANAAEFVFTSPTNVKNVDWVNHTVNHIDISIAGTANVSVPLAYGNYYGSEAGHDEDPILTVTDDMKLELSEDQMVDKEQLRITAEDMKRAVITAARADNGESIDDAFYITGFSGNVANATSNDQVRIEGSFLVADLRGTEYETVNDYYYNNNIWNYKNNVNQARLNNIVEYTVTVIKPLTYNLVDPDLGQLYDADGHPLTVTVDVAFSASFNYWDSENECPAVHGATGFQESTWQSGGVDPSNISGMDFVLGGNADEPESPLVALEITKVIMDEAGNRIELKTPVTNYFDIYENKSASNNEKNSFQGLHVVDDLSHREWTPDARDGSWLNNDNYKYWKTKSVKVDDRGSAIVFDFNATNAIYYIVEKHDEESLPRTVTDKQGNDWHYVKTYMETEYARRDEAPFSYDEYSNKELHPHAMHVTDEYSGDDDSYASIPEVAGSFLMLNGQRKKEGFLEFYVYNIYQKGVNLDVEKVWEPADEAPANTEVDVALYCAKRKIADSNGPLSEAQIEAWPEKADYVPAENEPLLNGKVEPQLILRPDAQNAQTNWKGSFEELPQTLTDTNGDVYEFDYYAKETAVRMNGLDVTDHYVSVTQKTEPSEEESVTNDGKVTITNVIDTLNVSVEKTWEPTPEQGSVTMKLRRYKKTLDNITATVRKVWDDDDNRDLLRPESLTVTLSNGTEVTLNEANNWTGSVSDLPIVSDDKPISYTWSEPAVSGYTQESVTYHGAETILTNKYDPETVDVTITINWDDANNQDGSRPHSVKATLSNGHEYIITGGSTASSWTKTVTVPKNEQGQPISYSWTKPDAPEGYTKTAEDANSVTFSHQPAPQYYTLNVTTSGRHSAADLPQNVRYRAGTVVTLTLSKRYDWDGDTYTVTGGPSGTVTFNGRYGQTTITMTMDRDYSLHITSNRNYQGSNEWWDDYLTYTLSPAPNANRSAQLNASKKTAAAPKLAESATRDGASNAYADAALPAAPEGYAIDSEFDDKNITVTLDGSGGWSQTFPGDYPKTDLLGNEYYYFVEEIAHSDAYYVEAYSDPLTDTGTITVHNTQKPGALTITKTVTVNDGEVPADNNTIADGTYTFTITGPENYSQVRTITVTGGVAESSIVLDNLTPGTYSVTETAGTNPNITLDTQTHTVTVEAGETAADNLVAVTNNLETTGIKVSKQWLDANGNLDTNNNTKITFTLNQIAYTGENDANAVEVPYAGTYPNEITGNDEVEISNLPVNGIKDGTPVRYAYTIWENTPEGYHDTYSISEDGTQWTIYNTPVANTDQFDDLTVTKKWKKTDGTEDTDPHEDDEITFTVTRHAVVTDYVPVTLNLFDSDSHGIPAKVKTYFVKPGTRLTLTFFNRDSRHFLTLSGAGNSDGRYVGDDRLTALYDRQTTFTVSSAMDISAQISNRAWSLIGSGAVMHDTWVDDPGHATELPATTKWDYSLTASGTNTLYEDAVQLADDLKGGEELANQPTYTYTMKSGDLISEGVEYDPEKTDSAFDPQAEDWVASLSQLPVYVKIGDHYETYTYTIGEYKINGVEVTMDASDPTKGKTDDYLVTIDQETNTITNKAREKVSVDATKAWLNADETTTPPAGASVTFELYDGDTATGKRVTLNGKIDVASQEELPEPDDNMHEVNAAAVAANAYESEAWKAFWADLPKYREDDTTLIPYTVKEVTGFDGYENQDPDGVAYTAESRVITNKETVTEINILKVDYNDETMPLTGAKFILHKYDEGYHENLKDWEEMEVSDEEGKEGTLKIEGLSVGYYELEETERPDGYVKTNDNPRFQVTLDDQTGELKVVYTDNTGGMVTYDPDSNIFLVRNKPGAALPMTGGIGTTVFTILGAILLASAGALLFAKRKQRI